MSAALATAKSGLVVHQPASVPLCLQRCGPPPADWPPL